MYRSTNHTLPRIPLALEQLTSRSNPTTSVYVTTTTSSDHGPRKLHTFLQISCPKTQLIRSVQVAQVRGVASKIPPISTITKSHTDTEPKIADCICRSRMFDAAVESRGWGPMKSPVPPDSHSSPRIIAACIQHTRIRGANDDHWAGKCASSCTVVVWVERIRAQGYISGLARQGSSLASDLYVQTSTPLPCLDTKCCRLTRLVLCFGGRGILFADFR